jgi:hypothetical protein
MRESGYMELCIVVVFLTRGLAGNRILYVYRLVEDTVGLHLRRLGLNSMEFRVTVQRI